MIEYFGKMQSDYLIKFSFLFYFKLRFQVDIDLNFDIGIVWFEGLSFMFSLIFKQLYGFR